MRYNVKDLIDNVDYFIKLIIKNVKEGETFYLLRERLSDKGLNLLPLTMDKLALENIKGIINNIYVGITEFDYSENFDLIFPKDISSLTNSRLECKNKLF